MVGWFGGWRILCTLAYKQDSLDLVSVQTHENKNMRNFFAFSTLSVLTLVIIFLHPVTAPPLSTNARWIVDDDNGQRVKLACVNWASHLEVMVAEGLSKQPVDVISKLIVSLGFNCVRLTWPLFLVTDDSLASMTVRKSFEKLGLIESIAGLKIYNPSFIDLSLIQAYKAVVSSLRKNNVMVILDNHISKPGWCCGNSGGGGNGFFGDQYFDPELWIDGLTRMAKMFKGVSNVVGMSLRNELRGSRQNVKDWYRYMQEGAEAVHSANPDVLVILSGLSYDKDLSFIRKQPVSLTFTGKLVFEVHWYGFTDGKAWQNGNPNQVCGRVMKNMMWLSEFLLQQGWPLFVSEFGMDQRGINVNDNRYINCFLGVAAELDFDWALWTLVGSYYLRQGVFGLDESYGMLSWNWCETRNSNFLQRISALQTPFQGLCVRRNPFLKSLKLGPCSESEPWTYSAHKTLSVKGTLSFLQAHDSNKPAKMGLVSSSSSSKWDIISKSRMHLSSKVSHGATVCLDADSNNNILTSPCKCLSRDITCDPSSQWFKLVDRTSVSAQTKPIMLSENISCWG